MDQHDDLSRRLGDERPRLSDERLDAVRRRVTPVTVRRGRRVTLATACVGLGLLSTGGSSALAISGFAASDQTPLRQQYSGNAGSGPAPLTLGGAPTATTDTSAVDATSTSSGPAAIPPATGSNPSTTPAPASGVKGTSTTSSPPSDDSGAVKDATASSGTPATTAKNAPSAAQVARQVEATGSGDTLPFTGWSAIPVLIAGMALLTVGVLLRRRERDMPGA